MPAFFNIARGKELLVKKLLLDHPTKNDIDMSFDKDGDKTSGIRKKPFSRIWK